MARNRSAITFSLIALGFLAACVELTSPSNADPDLIAARARWTANRPASYEFTLQLSCFCGSESTRPIVVAVTGTTVTGSKYADDGTPVSAWIAATLPSIDGLFDELAEAKDNNYSRADATYDAILGYPIQIAIDQREMTADDEYWYSVSGFRAR